MAAYAGNYYSQEVDATYHVAMDGTSLVVSARHVPLQPLTPVGPDAFRTRTGLTLQFERSSSGAPTAFTIELGRVRNIRFVKRG